MIRPITSCICLGTGRVREVWSGGHSADLAPAHEGDRNALPCPDCALCSGGCEERHDRAEMHDVDGELYCEICAAALVTLSMQALGMLPSTTHGTEAL